MPPRRKTVENARGLRRALTPPEIALWQWIRSRPQGLKFRRQHPIGPDVLDFYCAAARLAVEIDGSFHDSSEQVAHDARRGAWLRTQDVRVLRIKAVDVLKDLDSVARHVLASCISPPPCFAWSPSPSGDGED